jgi:hypothetical protein
VLTATDEIGSCEDFSKNVSSGSLHLSRTVATPNDSRRARKPPTKKRTSRTRQSKFLGKISCTKLSPPFLENFPLSLFPLPFFSLSTPRLDTLRVYPSALPLQLRLVGLLLPVNAISDFSVSPHSSTPSTQSHQPHPDLRRTFPCLQSTHFSTFSPFRLLKRPIVICGVPRLPRSFLLPISSISTPYLPSFKL